MLYEVITNPHILFGSRSRCSDDLPSCDPCSDVYYQPMYLRRCYRNKDGKRHAYWALVESYRTARGPRQRVVAWLGEMDERGRLAVRQQGVKDKSLYQHHLFSKKEPEWIEVDLKRMAVRNNFV